MTSKRIDMTGNVSRFGDIIFELEDTQSLNKQSSNEKEHAANLPQHQQVRESSFRAASPGIFNRKGVADDQPTDQPTKNLRIPSYDLDHISPEVLERPAPAVRAIELPKPSQTSTRSRPRNPTYQYLKGS
jgi:hypothetical protein